MNRNIMHVNYCITCIAQTVCIILYQTFSLQISQTHQFELAPIKRGRENVTIKTSA